LVGGTPGALATVPGYDCFALDSFDPSLLELTANPGTEHYLFSAEIRHADEAVGSSEVGLFFGLRYSEDRTAFGYYTLAFADIGFLAKRANKNGQSVSGLEVAAYVCRPPEAPHRMLVKKVEQFRPVWVLVQDDWRQGADRVPLGAGVGGGAAAAVNQWRRVGVRVNPAGVTVYFPDEAGGWRPVLTLPAELLEKRLQQLTEIHPQTAGIPTLFSPRTGLGLYVKRAGGWFRQVEIIPLQDN
jgi:hypothetical protein